MFSGISIWQLLILLVIVILLFGTKRLRHLGSDLGAAFRDFRKGLSEDEDKDKDAGRLEADREDEPTARNKERERSKGD